MSTSALPALLGLQGDASRRLVAGGVLRAPATLLRAQVSSRATALGEDGATWQDFGADTPRFQGAARRLLVEGQRTNLFRNPRFEGATAGVIGAGGAMPTNMTGTPGTNQTLEIIGVSTVQGLPCIEFQFTATASGTTTVMGLDAVMAAMGSTAYRASMFCQVTGGSTATFATFGYRVRTSASTAQNGAVISMAGASTGGLQRFEGTQTTLADATNIQLQLLIAPSAAGSVRFRLAAPQVGPASFASSPVLPVAGSPQVTTRGADIVTAALSGLGIGPAAACTVFWTGVLPQAAPAGFDQTLFQLDGGADNNRLRLRNAAGGSTIVAGHVAAGVATDAAALGSVAPGTAFRVGLTHDGAGRVAASLNGAAAQVVTGAPGSGFTTLRLGANAANGAGMFGETTQFSVLPYALTDAGLAAAVGALTA